MLKIVFLDSRGGREGGGGERWEGEREGEREEWKNLNGHRESNTEPPQNSYS